MEVKKAIKKVIAFSAGATMVGATVLSAMAAADLGAYPQPFVKDGAYDAIIVVGDNAAAQDVVGAVDIGASLQYAMKTTKKVQACSGATPTISNGIAIAKTGDYLNYAEKLSDVRSTALASDDLPTILANGKYTESKGNNNNDVTYTQKISLGTGSDAGKFNLLGYGVSPYPTDKDAADYIYFANNQNNQMYNYKLDFDSAVLYDNTTSATAVADVKDTQVEIQGAKYTITSVKATASGNALSELTLMAGDTLLWLTQDQKIQKTVAGVSHDIQVVDVTESADSCGVSVDGDVVWIDKGSSETINGVKVGVTDAKVIHAQLQDQDICQLNVGSSEVKLRGSSGKMQKDGADVNNAYGYMTSSASAGAQSWTGLNVTFYPNDRIYMGIGDSYNDPVFGRFKFTFSGLGNADYETMKMEVTADDTGSFTFDNYEGKQVTLPFYLNSTSVDSDNASIYLGSSVTEKLLQVGDSFTVTNAGDQIGTQFLFVTSPGSVAHVLKLDNLDTNNNKLTLKDVTYDKTYSDKTFSNNFSLVSTIDLGSAGSIQLQLNGTHTNFTGPAAGTIKSKNEATITVGGTLATAGLTNVSVLEKADQTGIGGTLTFDPQDVDGTSALTAKITLGNPTMSNSNLTSFVSQKYGSSDIKLGVSRHGSKVTYDEKDDKWITMQHPKKDVFANVFVAPISADVSNLGGDIETTTLERINLGAARLASEVKDSTADNMIVVGGPCANDVAATLMGQSGDACATGFTDGKAIIKLYEQSTGKVAMLVAGSSAVDTRRATRVVAGYDQYKSSLKGTEVAVTGTSLSDITVSAPQ